MAKVDVEARLIFITSIDIYLVSSTSSDSGPFD